MSIIISEEARKVAYQEIVNDTAKDYLYRQFAVGKMVQLTINSATAPLQKRLEELQEELNWQNNRNAGHPTKGGYEFYINEEWTGLADAALNADYGWHAALRKHRIDPDDERVRVRRVAEDDEILKQISELQQKLTTYEGRTNFCCECGGTKARIEELEHCLRQLFYWRLPLGTKVEEVIDEKDKDLWMRIHKLLNNE